MIAESGRFETVFVRIDKYNQLSFFSVYKPKHIQDVANNGTHYIQKHTWYLNPFGNRGILLFMICFSYGEIHHSELFLSSLYWVKYFIYFTFMWRYNRPCSFSKVCLVFPSSRLLLFIVNMDGDESLIYRCKLQGRSHSPTAKHHPKMHYSAWPCRKCQRTAFYKSPGLILFSRKRWCNGFKHLSTWV